MKNLTMVNSLGWSRDYEQSLTGELQLFVPAFCHASHEGNDSESGSLFVYPNPRKYLSGGGASRT